MEKILNVIKSLTWKQILATAVLVVAVAVAVAFATSCNVARFGLSGDKVVDKNVKDSVHYEVILEK